MSELKILHAADLHLDSPFEGLGAAKAAQRRDEQRRLLHRMTRPQLLCLQNPVQVVIFKGVFKQIAAVAIDQMHLRCA